MAGVNCDGARYTDYVDALAKGDRAIVQRDKSGDDLSRDGYIGLFRYEDFCRNEDGSISLKIVERLANARA